MHHFYISDQYTVEAKYFIPHGQVDWFKHPIHAPDAFEEGNIANIYKTIIVDISTTPEITNGLGGPFANQS